MVRFDYLDIKSPAVQQFLWSWVNPAQISFGMTKLDAMKELEHRFKSRQESLYGDLERGVAVRIQYPRPDVAMPHLLGNGMWIRAILQVGSGVLFGSGVGWIHIWTQDARIARVVEAFGFSRQAVLKGHGHIVSGQEEETFVLSLDRAAFYRTANILEVANG